MFYAAQRWLTLTFRPFRRWRRRTLTASVAAALLLAVAGFHIYWAAGGLWPGRDEASLARTVVGVGPMPGAAWCIGIALLLLVATGLLLAASGLVGLLPSWSSLIRFGADVAAAALLFRGAFGFVELWVHSAVRGTPYAHWNLILYSPLCLALGILIALSIRTE